MDNLPEIASLWIGDRLSFLEQLCLKSYVDRGHKVTLYAYEEVEGVPDVVELRDAQEIYRGAPYRVHFKHKSPAIHADYFRVKLMKRGHGEIWADTDAYCHKPFAFEDPHVYGWLDDNVNNGVFRLPPDSPALAAFDAFLEESAPLPPWMDNQTLLDLQIMRQKGFMIPIEAMPWGTTGPQALTYFLRQSGEIEYAMPEPVFYPMNWGSRRLFLKTQRKFEAQTDERTVSYHFLGRIVRRILAQEYGGLPKPGSVLERLCEEHEIDPKAAPIIRKE